MPGVSDEHHPYEGERWQPGDLVLDAEGSLFTRAGLADQAGGRPWGYPDNRTRRLTGEPFIPEGIATEDFPVRPLTLMLRDGRPILPGVPDDISGIDGTAAREAASTAGVGGLFLAATAFDPDGAGDVRAARLRADLLDSVIIVDNVRDLHRMFRGAADGLLVVLADNPDDPA